jgi:hypothetical protein
MKRAKEVPATSWQLGQAATAHEMHYNGMGNVSQAPKAGMATKATSSALRSCQQTPHALRARHVSLICCCYMRVKGPKPQSGLSKTIHFTCCPECVHFSVRHACLGVEALPNYLPAARTSEQQQQQQQQQQQWHRDSKTSVLLSASVQATTVLITSQPAKPPLLSCCAAHHASLTSLFEQAAIALMTPRRL